MDSGDSASTRAGVDASFGRAASQEDRFIIRYVPFSSAIDEHGMQAFMAHCAATLGSDFFLTPRDAVKAFVGLLSVIEQNPGADWRVMLSATTVERTSDPEVEPVAPDVEGTRAGADDLESFQL